MINQASLHADLQALGLQPADTVLIHSSMKSIGQVAGGAEGVLDALASYFAPGLLAFPTLSWTTSEMEHPAFDVLETPSIVGILPELFRRRPGVTRSFNPTHSVSALGRDARAFTAGGHLDGTPCGPRSPWHELVTRDGFILMVGCDLTTCTFLHGVEEWCGIPGRIGEPRAYSVTLPDGGRTTLYSAAHAASPSVNYWKIEAGLRQAGLLREGTFGEARTLVLPARELYAYTAGCLSQNPALFDG